MKSESELVKPNKYPVTLRLDEDDLPELKSWKVGGKYKLTIDVEQISMSKGDEYGEMDSKEKPKTRATFKITNIATLGGSNTKDAKRSNALADAMRKRV